jgi:hypothetical protein
MNLPKFPFLVLVVIAIGCGQIVNSSAKSGACGSSNGTVLTGRPSTGLCSAGTASAVGGSGPWYWSCGGVNGGTSASCAASALGPDGGILAPADGGVVLLPDGGLFGPPDGGFVFPDSGVVTVAGNPDGGCSTLTLPAEAQLVNVSTPTTVVGTGTPASCTFSALASVVSKGGIITFNCGSAPVTITVTSTLTPPTSNAYASDPPINTVIDGANLITLDGAHAVRILSWIHSGSWQKNTDTLTLQRLRLINGQTTPTQVIPYCAPSGSIPNTACSTGWDDGQGGAINMRDGSLRVIDCIFEGNQAALLGPDTGGGAIYLYGSGKNLSFIVNSTFQNNVASNAGAVGMLWAGASIFNSLFEGNMAVGTGANSVDATKCTCSNYGNNNQVGSGGNGGALYKDGADGANLTICGTQIRENSANEFGAAVFLTADGSPAQLVIDDSLITNNSDGVPYWQWCTTVSTDNPHGSSNSSPSPSPLNTTFCDTKGTCATTCSQ